MMATCPDLSGSFAPGSNTGKRKFTIKKARQHHGAGRQRLSYRSPVIGNASRKNMITHVAYKEQPSVKHITNEFLAESFEYDKLADTYTCPAGAILTSLAT